MSDKIELSIGIEGQFVNPRFKKFLSYYKPYMGLFYSDMVCAIIVLAITLALPLLIRFITQNLLTLDAPNALSQIYIVGAFMLVLVAIFTACHAFIDYRQ
jgi:ATP-binding cassette, subfamily B, bacterial